MKLGLLSRVTRIGFLPVLLASNFSIAFMLCGQLNRNFDIQHALTISGNLLLMLYGSLLNDLCDQVTDARNPAAKKPFAQGVLTRGTQATSVWVAMIATALCDFAILAWLWSHSQAPATFVFAGISLGGLFFATAYSLPPIRARARLFGATWTLMLYHPICCARLVVVTEPLPHLPSLAVPLMIVAAYLWAVHGITTVAMKDVPDAFADRAEAIRSIPNVFGARTATALSLCFVALSLGIALVAYEIQMLNGRFFIFALPVAGCLCALAEYLRRWFERASVEGAMRDNSPRHLFHAVGYPATWGILIPAFVLNVRLR